MLAIMVLLIGCAFAVWSASTRHSSSIGKERIRQNQEIGQLVLESVNGARQIKVFSVEKRALADLNERLEKLMNALRRFALTNALPPAFSEFFIVLVFVSGLLIQNYWLKVNLSDLLATAGVFALAGMRLFNASSTLFAKRMAVIAYWPSIAVVHEHATREASRHESPDKGVRLTEPVTRLSVEGVKFSFDVGEPLFDGLNLEVGRGLYAFAGKSGSGKSTLCDLVAKLYSPQSGFIGANGIDLSGVSTASWRARLGYVSQDNFMFHASIADNVSVGASGAGREAVREAARLADAAGFIESLPEGYDTIIGQGGISLSGGQRQRIAIARALIRRPDVIIFDEATSALDAESEVKILAELKKLAATSIVLVTTHRLRTLAVADRIFWFESGRLEEAGSYGELIQAKGKFASLATAGA
jgi:ABC-type multidrug transport system fused ATPase/permease subunit